MAHAYDAYVKSDFPVSQVPVDHVIGERPGELAWLATGVKQGCVAPHFSERNKWGQH